MYEPCSSFPPKPDRVGVKSIKVTTQSPRLACTVRRTFKTNGAAPKNMQVRRSRKA